MQIVAPRRKKFGDKWYDFDEGFAYKYEAERKANHLRAGNYYARILAIPNVRGYVVYARVKPAYVRSPSQYNRGLTR